MELRIPLLACFACTLLSSNIQAGASEGFITASGNKFMLGGEEYKAVGMCNYPFSFGNFDYIERTTLRAKAAGVTLIRGCITFDDDFSQWDDEAQWRKIDWLLAVCAREDMRVMIDLSGFRSPLQKGLKVDCWAPESYPQWDALVDFATSRLNTFTGVPYKEDPVIFQWLISGESVPYGFNGDVQSESRDVNVVENLLIHVAERLQIEAPNHLISAGGLLHMSVPLDNSGQDYWKTLWSNPAIDCGAIHIYLDDYSSLPGGSWNRLEDYKDYCDSIGKPFVLEEWGIDIYTNTMPVAENYYHFGFDLAHELEIPITVNWDWAPYGGFSVFPGHADELLTIVSENTRRWGHTGSIGNYTDPPLQGETLWNFEDGEDRFSTTNYGGNDGAPRMSTLRSTLGLSSLRVPVSFTSTNWNFAGITRYCTPRLNLSDSEKIACDIWAPKDTRGLLVKFIIANEKNTWTSYAQRSEINNWIEGGKWNTVYADLSSSSAIDWGNAPPDFSNVVTVTMEIHHAHGTPTFSGDLYIDNFRVGNHVDPPTPMGDLWSF